MVQRCEVVFRSAYVRTFEHRATVWKQAESSCIGALSRKLSRHLNSVGVARALTCLKERLSLFLCRSCAEQNILRRGDEGRVKR